MSENPLMLDASIELVAFVGLGAMGGPMCANLARKSPVPTLAYDLDPNAVQAAVSSGSVAANDLADISRADIVFICLPGEEQTRAVCLAEGGLCDHAKAGQIVVDCTTATVRVNLDVSEALATKGAHFADAPVARGVPNAHDGTLSITVGASEEIFNRVAPWLSYMGTDVAYCGPVGTGTVMKLMNNMVLFENVSALAEAMAIATRAGVPRSRVLDLRGQGSADSFALRRHGSFMTSGDYPTDRFPTTYSLKDLDYALDLADQVGVDAKGARLIRERFSEIVDRGMGHFYSPVVYELFEDE
ncbi:MAG: NAD(P)-dependent oxidoreductase [Actinomycetota bacterium]|nr:NAD(P)-dependent oxidoreductase [Actinomycetota bacterium]